MQILWTFAWSIGCIVLLEVGVLAIPSLTHAPVKLSKCILRVVARTPRLSNCARTARAIWKWWFTRR
jgi:hypothetical protein